MIKLLIALWMAFAVEPEKAMAVTSADDTSEEMRLIELDNLTELGKPRRRWGKKVWKGVKKTAKKGFRGYVKTVHKGVQIGRAVGGTWNYWSQKYGSRYFPCSLANLACSMTFRLAGKAFNRWGCAKLAAKGGVGCQMAGLGPANPYSNACTTALSFALGTGCYTVVRYGRQFGVHQCKQWVRSRCNPNLRIRGVPYFGRRRRRLRGPRSKDVDSLKPSLPKPESA